MPQTIEPLRDASAPNPNPIRWTRTQCDLIRDSGVLTGRYELIDGEIISKIGQKPPHAVAVTLVMTWLAKVFGGEFLRIQLTADAGGADPEHNEPEPDLAVTRRPVRAYLAGHPGPEDLLLVVEISDSTLRFDRTKKAALYALSGIQEYWIVDVNGRQLLVHRRPAGDTYLDIIAYREEESVAPLARPDEAVRVSELLP